MRLKSLFDKFVSNDYRTLDKTISSLEMQLAAARAAKGDTEEASPVVTKLGTENLKARRKVFFVMGIITAFSSRKRRDSIRETWMPKGLEHKKNYSTFLSSTSLWFEIGVCLH